MSEYEISSGGGTSKHTFVLYGLIVALIGAMGYLYMQLNQTRVDLATKSDQLLDEVAKVRETSAVSTQTIMVRPDSPVNYPQQLSGRSVGVNFHAGSHYLALMFLEGFLPRAEINVVHAGRQHRPQRAVRYGPTCEGQLLQRAPVELRIAELIERDAAQPRVPLFEHERTVSAFKARGITFEDRVAHDAVR